MCNYFNYSGIKKNNTQNYIDNIIKYYSNSMSNFISSTQRMIYVLYIFKVRKYDRLMNTKKKKIK